LKNDGEKLETIDTKIKSKAFWDIPLSVPVPKVKEDFDNNLAAKGAQRYHQNGVICLYSCITDLPYETVLRSILPNFPMTARGKDPPYFIPSCTHRNFIRRSTCPTWPHAPLTKSAIQTNAIFRPAARLVRREEEGY
jgi:hypothetical protein